MTEFDLMRHTIDRPSLYYGRRTGSAVIGFISGYTLAKDRAGQRADEWAAVIELLRVRLDPSSAGTARVLLQSLEAASGGDDAKAYDVFMSEFRRAIDDVERGRGQEVRDVETGGS